MATLPTSGTDIRFLSGVPFSITYDKTRWFDSEADQETYFLARPLIYRMTSANFQRTENKEYISVSKPIEELYSTNYVMFKNAAYGDKWFYGFVTHLEYKNRTCTYVHIQLDVLQTWLRRLTFKPSFVVREHRPLWNSDGTPVLNTVDEGLAYGLDYDTVSVQHFQPSDGILFLVIISKTPMHAGDNSNKINPSSIGVAQPLTYYLVPYDPKNGATVVSTGDGDSLPMNKPEQVLKDLYDNESAVNNIVSMYITDSIGMKVTIADKISGQPTVVRFSQFSFLENVTIGENTNCLHVKSLPTFSSDLEAISDNKYADFAPVTESKLLMYPYTNIVLDDFKGNRTAYKLEYIQGKNLSLMVKGSLGLSHYVSYGVDRYNHGDFMDNPLFTNLNNESALISNIPNDVTVVNDFLAAFLQGNRNQLEIQKDTIQFNGFMNGVKSVVSGVESAASMAVPPSVSPRVNTQTMQQGIGGIANAGVDLAQGVGNTVLQLQAMEAKQADISNIPPSISKMGSNTAYSMGHGFDGIYILKKQIKSEYRRKLTDFFNSYGYKTNEVKIPNIHTRRYWNYVQTKGINIDANMNFADLHEIKQIFDNGITLWHTNDIGNYDLENEVL